MPHDARDIIAIDSSVAIPLILQRHLHHAATQRWRDRVSQVIVCGHAWWETYSVITRLPGPSRVGAEDAVQILESEFGAPLVPVARTWEALATLGELQITGGATYDAWIALTARDHGVRLATRDSRALPTYRATGVDVVIVESAGGKDLA